MNITSLKARFSREDTALPPTIDHRRSSILRIFMLLILGGLASLILVTMWFAYIRVETTIGQVQSIILLQSELQIEPIDFNRLEKVEAAWTEKRSTSTISTERDPFQAVRVPASATSTKAN